jgi:hypothetical protein
LLKTSAFAACIVAAPAQIVALSAQIVVGLLCVDILVIINLSFVEFLGIAIFAQGVAALFLFMEALFSLVPLEVVAEARYIAAKIIAELIAVELVILIKLPRPEILSVRAFPRAPATSEIVLIKPIEAVVPAIHIFSVH